MTIAAIALMITIAAIFAIPVMLVWRSYSR
jgi:hypothetical protein